MRKNTLILTMAAVMMFCFMPIAQAQAQASNDIVTAQDVKKDTQELINTLQQYTVDQRDQAIEDADQALKKLDGQIDELESRVDNNWDNMSQAAKQKTRASLKMLRQQRNNLAEWYGSFKNSSAGAWEQMKKGFSDAYQAMSDSWEKAIGEYDTDNSSST